MTQNLSQLVDAQRQRARAAADQIVTRAESENRALTPTEAGELDDHLRTIGDLSNRLRELGTDVDTLAPIPQARGVGGAIIRNEPTTYQKGGRYSHVADMARAACQQADNATLERLQRHAQEMDVELRAGDTGDTAGGTFVPPKWVVEEFVGVQRAGRATADLARRLGLPGGTDQVNIPTITTGTVTDVQATENTAATTRDMVTGSTTADVSTIAGTYDFSLQLLEQSALARGFDQLIYADLLADYNRRLDVMVLNGTGANNQASGIHTVAATTVYASSTSSTTAQNQIYAALGDAINRVATTRFESPDVVLLHPRRWFWLCSRLDLDGRPLIVPDAQAGQNLLAAAGITNAQGVVGTMFGLPVVVDANVSTSAGTSEDRIAVWKASDAVLMEGMPRFEVFRSIGGATTDTLTARARLYSYVAFSPRYATSIALVGGTALSSPTFA
jgi:HK97 family phage major capsid protein